MEQLNAKFPCRGQQIQALSTLFAVRCDRDASSI
jgi:hypothetical protein